MMARLFKLLLMGAVLLVWTGQPAFAQKKAQDIAYLFAHMTKERYGTLYYSAAWTDCTGSR